VTIHVPKAPCDADVADQALPLFGTVNNAQRLLRLSLPYPVANAALRGQPVTAEVNDAVTIAWRTWCQLYVRGLAFSPDMTFRLPDTVEAAYQAMNELSEQEAAEWRRVKGRIHVMGAS